MRLHILVSSIFLVISGMIIGWIILSIVPESFQEPQKVTRTDTFSIGEYLFIFGNSCPKANSSFAKYDCAGLNYGNKTIFIKSGQTVESTITTCNHEICHTILEEDPNVEEYLCTNIQNYLKHPVCERMKELFK